MNHKIAEPTADDCVRKDLGYSSPTTLRCMANDLRLFPIHFLTVMELQSSSQLQTSRRNRRCGFRHRFS